MNQPNQTSHSTNMMMKRAIHFLLFSVLCIYTIGCGSTATEVQISSPLRPKYAAPGYKKIYIADFNVFGEQDVDRNIRFNVNKEIRETLRSEFKDRSGYAVEDLKVSYDKGRKPEEILQDTQFWSALDIKDKENSIILTGAVDFSNHQKSGLVTQHVTNPQTGVQRDLTSSHDQLQLVLDINLYLIDATSGGKLFQEDFKEEQTYDDVTTVSLPLFYDVFERMAPKIVGILVPYRVSGSRLLLEP